MAKKPPFLKSNKKPGASFKKGPKTAKKAAYRGRKNPMGCDPNC